MHKTVFFKKGKMKGYAHPIVGTKDWCNEIKAKKGETSPEPEEEMKDIPAEELHRFTTSKVNIEDLINDLQILWDSKVWTQTATGQMLIKLGARPGVILDMIKSLAPDKLIEFDNEIKKVSKTATKQQTM